MPPRPTMTTTTTTSLSSPPTTLRFCRSSSPALLLLQLLLLLSSSSSASSSKSRGLTDDSALARRAGVPDASLCESGDAGHRRATTMGDDFLKRGRLLHAEACYLGALHHKSDFPMALYGLGEVHARENRDALAREAYHLAVEVWPAYVDAHIALGDLHHRHGRLRKAEASYNEAIKAAPHDPMAWEALGKYQLLIGKPDRAENTYKRAALKAVDGARSPGLVLGLAKAARAGGKFAECVEHGEKAASLAPAFGMPRHTVGLCKVAMVGRTPAPNCSSLIFITRRQKKALHNHD